MKKIVKLNEADLTRIISKTINEIRDKEGIDLYMELKELLHPYYKKQQPNGGMLSSRERIVRIKQVISELEDYVGILKNELSAEQDRESGRYSI
jgi:hypothetical protein|tara:strand:+ start:62 stop:343 length:282 start_codon:yes stop_codon:yes gene_type:complete